MISFYQMMNLLEAKATDEALWAYYRYVQQNPNFDDLKTLLSMIEQTYSGRDATGMFADFLGGIRSQIIPKLDREEQRQAYDVLSKMQAHPKTDMYMRINNFRKFNDVQEFEEFILQCIENNQPSSAMKVVQNPDNQYWWQMTADDIKEELRDALKREQQRIRNQPTFAQLIQRQLKNQKDDENWDA
jgi:hypothetical protein